MTNIAFLNVANPVWGDSAHTRITCDVTWSEHPHLSDQTHPFAAAEADPSAPHSEEIFARCLAGEFGPIAEYAETPQIPTSITPLQARKALRAAGYKSAVDAYVATLSEEDQEEWEYATAVERTHPVIVNGGAALGLTSDQIDQLFIQAASS